MLAVGQTFAQRFEIRGEIGRGGMGVVYDAWDTSLKRPVALKTIKGSQSDKSLARFRREAEIAAQLGTRYLPVVFDTAVTEGVAWIAMERLEGETLARRAVSGIDRGEVSRVVQALGRALGHAHKKGVVHCDLKPENLFLATGDDDEGWSLKLLDFGIARMVAADHTHATNTEEIGSAAWMAPELTDTRGKVSPPTDVWSLGMLGYWLLTGRSYWEGASNIQVLSALLQRDPLPAATERATATGVIARLPAGFDAWFARCVERDARARHANAAECCNALLALFDASARVSGPSVAPPPPEAREVPSTSPLLRPSWDVGAVAHSVAPTHPLPPQHPPPPAMAYAPPSPTVAMGAAPSAPMASPTVPMASPTELMTPAMESVATAAPRAGRGIAWGASTLVALLAVAVGVKVWPQRDARPPLRATPWSTSGADASAAPVIPQPIPAPTLTPTPTPPSVAEVVARTNPWVRVREALAMQRHEVTREEYAAWRAPSSPLPEGERRLPVVGVSHDDATAFCETVGGRLPTQAEWRGVLGPTRGWGQRVMTEGATAPSAVESDPNDARVFGGEAVRDLVGSVMEWTATRRGDGYVAMGSAWSDPQAFMADTLSAGTDVSGTRETVGFRCVR